MKHCLCVLLLTFGFIIAACSQESKSSRPTTSKVATIEMSHKLKNAYLTIETITPNRQGIYIDANTRTDRLLEMPISGHSVEVNLMVDTSFHIGIGGEDLQQPLEFRHLLQMS